MSNEYSFLENIDIFGSDIEFNIQKNKKSTTKIGGFLTIICFLIIIAAIYSISDELISKNQPIIDVENVVLPKRPYTTYNSTNFPISFCLQDYDQKTYNIEKYFRFEVSSILTSNKNKSTLQIPIEYENCTYSHFPNFNKEYIDTAGILKYLCLKKKNFTLGGFWDEEIINYLSIKINICNNQTYNNSCAPINEINDWFRSRPIALNLYFGNNKINHRNYKDPIYNLIDVLYKNIKLSSSKILNVYLKSQEVETDVGLIFNEKINLLTYTYDENDFDESELIDGDLMSIRLFASNKHLIYHRRYKKILDFLALIGGLKNALFMILKIIIYHYSRIKFNEKIINKVYNFNPNNLEIKYVFNKISKEFEEFDKNKFSKYKKINQNGNNKVKSKYNRQFSFFNNNERRELKKSKTTNSPIKSKIDKSPKIFIDKIDISLCGFMKIMIFGKCLNKNSKLKIVYDLYKKAHNDILYSLDVRNIVKTHEEIKLLKFILFDFDQLVIFRYAINFLGTIEERRKFSEILGNVKELNLDEKKMKSFISDFKLGRKDNLSDIDFRLINFIS